MGAKLRTEVSPSKAVTGDIQLWVQVSNEGSEYTDPYLLTFGDLGTLLYKKLQRLQDFKTENHSRDTPFFIA